MVKITQTYTLELTKEEVATLKKLLGKRSLNTDKEKGLTEIESEIISDIYFILPCLEDEEDE